MATPTRVALLGCGYFAEFHREAWCRLDDAQLVAVCDRGDNRAQDFAGRSPGARAYRDAAAMLDATRPDLLDIATPPASHLELVKLAAQRDIPVICQKPLAPTLDEATEIVETAETAGISLVVHENIRFAPWHQEIHRLIRAGQLGQLHGIAKRLRPGDGQGPAAYLARQPYFQTMERFLVHETAIHWIDTFRFLLGEVTGVFARLRRLNPAIRGEDAGIILFEFAGGGSGVFDGNRLNEHPSDNLRRTMGELWVEGEAGVLRLDGAGRLFLKPHGEAEREHGYAWKDKFFAGDAVYNTQRHILARLRAGTTPANTGRAYLRNFQVEEAIYRSAVDGYWQTLPATPS